MRVVYFALLFAEIIILFLLSQLMSKALSKFMSINLLSIIFLPGIIIHELAHLFMAAILLVPVGDMEFIPRKQGDGVKLGSVEIARTDPVRRSIIGFAPVLAGLMIVVGAVYLFVSNISFFQNKNLYVFIAAILVLFYLLFAIGNTMFSSRADMKGTAEILIALLLIFAAANILGFRPSPAIFEKMFSGEIIEAVRKAAIFLLAPIAINLFIFGAIKLFRFGK